MLDEHRQRRLKKITQSIIGLPTLPTVITQLMTLIDSPKTSGRQVAQLISTDQALTAKILKLANSSFYGFPREISTVQHAVVILGFETVKSLGLSVSVLQRFSGPSDNTQFDRQGFWEHSIACGVSARLLAGKLRYRLPGEAFAAGILHDVGKLILSQYFPAEFALVIERMRSEDLYIGKAEELVLGLTHSEVGSWLAEKWNLPGELVEVISRHHGPFPDDEDAETGSKLIDLTYIVHAADALCRHQRIGASGDARGPALHPHVARVFKKDREMSDEALFDLLGAGLEAEIERAEVFRRWSEKE